MARTMKDKNDNKDSQSLKKNKIALVKKTIKKSPVKNISQAPAQALADRTKQNKKNLLPTSSKTRKSKYQTRIDNIMTLTSQILKNIESKVEIKENKSKSKKKNTKSKIIKKDEFETKSNYSKEQKYDSQKQNFSLDDKSKSTQTQRSKNRAYSNEQIYDEQKVFTRSTYKKQTRSGKQYGLVKIRGGPQNEEMERGINSRSSSKRQSCDKKPSSKLRHNRNQSQNQKQNLRLQSVKSNENRNQQKNCQKDEQIQELLKDQNQSFKNKFMEQKNQAYQSIKNTKLSNNQKIIDESQKQLLVSDDKIFSFSNSERKVNKIHQTPLKQNNNLKVVTTSSKDFSFRKEDISNNNYKLNQSNIHYFKDSNQQKYNEQNKSSLPNQNNSTQMINENIKRKKRYVDFNYEDNEQNIKEKQKDMNKQYDFINLQYDEDMTFNSLQKNCNPLKRQTSNLDDYQTDEETGKQLVDIVFCCDTTSSMGEYLDATIDYIAAIYKKTLPFEQIIDIKYGFVCYRDHPPEESSYLYRLNNLTSPLKTIQFIQQQDAEGGGDTPEAVMDGLYVATSGINWRKNSMKYIIHIADAPPHGDLYTGTSGGFLQKSFVWRDGCPCGLTIQKIAKIMNNLQIHYRLIKAGDNMERMASIFKSCIEHYADIKVDSPQGLDFILSDMVAKQCLNQQDIENLQISKYQKEIYTKDSDNSKNQNIDHKQRGRVIEQEQTFKGINRTYSNNFQAFKNNDEKQLNVKENSIIHQQNKQSNCQQNVNKFNNNQVPKTIHDKLYIKK